MVHMRATTGGQVKRPRWFTKPDPKHLVQLYDDTGVLTACLLEYVSTGLERGEICMVVATPEVLIDLQKTLRSRGIDVAEALSSGQYQAYDAEGLLEQLMDGRSVSGDKFRQEVGTLVAANTANGKTLRIYCEMVGLLLQQQNAKAALEAEHDWDLLMEQQPFSLYCAYPETAEQGIDYQSCHIPSQSVHSASA